MPKWVWEEGVGIVLESGAFTGPVTDKLGYIDQAEGGTFFLYELGDIGLSAQAKL
jgi:transcriptional regulator with GAF, ATPase, and Fis domain